VDFVSLVKCAGKRGNGKLCQDLEGRNKQREGSDSETQAKTTYTHTHIT
jgi:hypothetical protein